MFEAYSVMQTGKLIIFKGTVVTATNNASCVLRSPTSVFYLKLCFMLQLSNSSFSCCFGGCER